MSVKINSAQHHHGLSLTHFTVTTLTATEAPVRPVSCTIAIAIAQLAHIIHPERLIDLHTTMLSHHCALWMQYTKSVWGRPVLGLYTHHIHGREDHNAEGDGNSKGPSCEAVHSEGIKTIQKELSQSRETKHGE